MQDGEARQDPVDFFPLCLAWAAARRHGRRAASGAMAGCPETSPPNPAVQTKGIVTKLEITELDLGPNPPRIDSFRTVNSEPDELVLEASPLGVRWLGDRGRAPPARFRDVQLRGGSCMPGGTQTLTPPGAPHPCRPRYSGAAACARQSRLR